MNLLIDENMPRSLVGELSALGFNAQDARDIGLLGRPDEEVLRVAVGMDAIISLVIMASRTKRTGRLISPPVSSLSTCRTTLQPQLSRRRS